MQQERGVKRGERDDGEARPALIPQKCPRCDSLNTKFCYYNNYSLSQPRYFCKTCRRYWTQGGTLRNVPVGGGCRKGKRSRTAAPIPGADVAAVGLASPFASSPSSYPHAAGGYLSSISAIQSFARRGIDDFGVDSPSFEVAAPDLNCAFPPPLLPPEFGQQPSKMEMYRQEHAALRESCGPTMSVASQYEQLSPLNHSFQYHLRPMYQSLADTALWSVATTATSVAATSAKDTVSASSSSSCTPIQWNTHPGHRH